MSKVALYMELFLAGKFKTWLLWHGLPVGVMVKCGGVMVVMFPDHSWRSLLAAEIHIERIISAKNYDCHSNHISRKSMRWLIGMFGSC